MSFTIHKHDHAGRKPWEYVPAHAGTYHVGEALHVSGGLVDHVDEDGCCTGVVKYICMAECTTKEGQMLPVVRVTSDEIYKIKCNEGEEVSVGQMVAVYRNSLYPDEEGCFEIVQVDGTDVYGRFLESEKSEYIGAE